MTYSGAAVATQSRQMLGTVLEALQKDPQIPPDVLSVAENIAHAVGALFEAERASSEVDGKASVRHAMGSLSQTMALLQDVSTRHAGVGSATRTLAEVMSKLYPLGQALTVRPSRPSTQTASQAPAIPAPAAVPKEAAAAPTARASAAAPATAARPSKPPPAVVPAPVAPSAPAAAKPTAPEVQRQAPPAVAHQAHVPAPTPAAAPAAAAPPAPAAPAAAAYAPTAPAVPAPAAAAQPLQPPEHTGKREQLEANIGATTESNFFVGFSGDIAEGGVFVATYLTLPVSTRVEVLVTLPGGFEKSIPGTVRFVRDPMDMDSEPGIGVRFDRLEQDARELILRFIRKRPPLFYDE
ncbi:MAG: PilZ domain-containing protein [Polyangiales bacterium]